jgi:hypothetical protein
MAGACTSDCDALGEKRIAGLVGIGHPEVTNEAFVIMVFNVLQRGFRDHVAVGVFLFRVGEKPQG